jgi:hypothetical protein
MREKPLAVGPAGMEFAKSEGLKAQINPWPQHVFVVVLFVVAAAACLFILWDSRVQKPKADRADKRSVQR